MKKGYPDQMLMKVRAHSAQPGSASQFTPCRRTPVVVRM